MTITSHDIRWLAELAELPQAQAVTRVLCALQARGVGDPAVASGFTRSLLMGTPPTDVDIHYTGAIPTAMAEVWLAEILAKQRLDGEWDIWNFTEHDPHITTRDFGYLAHFVSTIDCVYLGPDSTFHDLTGRGASDARERVLAFPHLTVVGYPYSAGQLCYLYLEGCRRIVLHDLTPTPTAARALCEASGLWRAALPADRAYLRARVRDKLTLVQRQMARPRYARFGWDLVFDDED